MKWGRILRWATAITLFTAVCVCHAVEGTAPSEKINLRILYVGKPDSSREKDFVEFLAGHFSEVETGNLAEFSEGQADGFDVVIFDWEGRGFDAPRPRLSQQYTRPTVTVGVAGAGICNSLGLKSGYL